MIFRLRAANAADVVLNGDWPEGRGVKLAKDDQGAWSATVGPLTPELWYYTFNVDGASVVDPSNANLLRDGTCYMNFLSSPARYRRTMRSATSRMATCPLPAGHQQVEQN